MKKLVPLACLAALWLSAHPAEAGNLKMTTVRDQSGYVETAHISHYHHEVYIGGWLKPYFWLDRETAFKVEIKSKDGKIIATKTGCVSSTGRPQITSQFGLSYVVSFHDSQLDHAAAIDVSLIN